MVVLTHDVDPQGDLVVVLGMPNSTYLIPKVYIKKCWSGISYFIRDWDIFNVPKVKSILQAVDDPGKRPHQRKHRELTKEKNQYLFMKPDSEFHRTT